MFTWNRLAIGALGLLALVAASPIGQVIAVIGMISVIGLPIAVIVVAIPAVFLVALAAELAWEAWTSFRAGRHKVALAFAVALLVMANLFVFRAWRVNEWLDERVATLVAQDVDKLTPPGTIGTLAVLRPVRGSFENDTACDDLCRRLLLTGSARQVIALTVEAKVDPKDGDATPWPAQRPAEGLSGTAWRLERRDHCPDTVPLTSQRAVQLPEPEKPKGTRITMPVGTEQLMRLAIAGGNCLVGGQATLAQADALLAYGEIRWPGSTFAAGYAAWTDTIAAWRLGFWFRRNGALVPEYQRTGVRWARLPGAFIPWLETGQELRTGHGWARFSAYRNRSRFEEQVPLGAFVTERLGLDLRPAVGDSTADPTAAPQATLRSEQARAADRILASTGALAPVEAQVIADYFDGIGSAFAQRAGARADAEDAARVLRILQDRRIALPSSGPGAVRFAAATDPALAGAMAVALADRMARIPPVPIESRSRDAWNTQVRATSGALAQLPAAAVQPFQAMAVELTRDRDRRALATFFLGHLDLFGPAIVPDVFAMMDDAVQLRDPKVKELEHLRYTWSDVWRAGALSICRLAPQIPGSLDDIRSRTRALLASKITIGDVPVAAAMLRMGATEDDVRATLVADPTNEAARRSFEFTLRRAQRPDACQ